MSFDAKVKTNPAFALASLMETHGGQSELGSVRPSPFVRIDGAKDKFIRPPLYSGSPSRNLIFDLLAAGVRRPGDSMRVVRLSEERIGIFPEGNQRDEEELVDAYADYVTSLNCRQKFARTWRDFSWLMMNSVEAIADGIGRVLAQRGGREAGTRVEEDSHLEAIAQLLPHSRSLRTFFYICRFFYRNEFMKGKWETAFIEGQRHLLGNSLFSMVSLDTYINSNKMRYEDLSMIQEGALEVFNPVFHIETAFSIKAPGRWLEASIDEDSIGADIRPDDGPKLKRVLDEILYRAGSKANGAPERISVGWHGASRVLSLRAPGNAFHDFRDAMPARFSIEQYFGKERLEFISDAPGPEARVSEIRIAVADGWENGDDDIGGGFVAGSGGQDEPGSGDGTHSLSSKEFLGAASYATAGTAAKASVAIAMTTPVMPAML